MTAAIVTALGVVAVVVTGVYLGLFVYLSGRLDAEYPTVASGDIYRRGSLRDRLYNLGLRHGAFAVKRKEVHRQMTELRARRRAGGAS